MAHDCEIDSADLAGPADLLAEAGDLSRLTPRQLHAKGLAYLETAVAHADSAAAWARVAQAFFFASVSAQALDDDENAAAVLGSMANDFTGHHG